MPTNIDTAVTLAAALDDNSKAHIFVMSNGDLVVFYKLDAATNGWGYRVKHGGAWGSFVALSNPGTTTHLNATWMVSCRNGDTIYLASLASTWKLVYNTGTQLFTQTSTDRPTADGGQPILGLYYDSTNTCVHHIMGLASAGVFLYALDAGTLALKGGSDTAVTNSLAYGTFDVLSSQTTTLVGDGTSTFYFIQYSDNNATFQVVTKVVYNGSAYTQTAESGMPAHAAACKGLTAVYDGTNIIIVINENNTKLRATRRTGVNTYDAFTNIETNTVGGTVSLTKTGSSDVWAIYKRTSSQANGEICYLKRSAGAWGSVTLLAGGASTGWSVPSSDPTDANDTAGFVRVVYLTGTANPWTLVEDSIGASAISVQAVPASTTFSAATPTLSESVVGVPASSTFNAPAPTVSETVVGVPANANFSAPAPSLNQLFNIQAVPGSVTFSGLSTVGDSLQSVPATAVFGGLASVSETAVTSSASVAFSSLASVGNIILDPVGTVTFSASASVGSAGINAVPATTTFRGGANVTVNIGSGDHPGWLTMKEFPSRQLVLKEFPSSQLTMRHRVE